MATITRTVLEIGILNGMGKDSASTDAVMDFAVHKDELVRYYKECIPGSACMADEKKTGASIVLNNGHNVIW